MDPLLDWSITAAYIVLGFIVLLIAKLLMDLLTPYKLDEHLTGKDNPALGLSVVGYLLGSIIIFIGATKGEFHVDVEPTAKNLAMLMGIDFAYAIGGILCLNIGRLLVDKVMLPRFSSGKEIIDDRNVGMGAVEFANYLATALIICGSISGVGGGPGTALACFALGQVAMILFAKFYQLITPFDVAAELEKDNVSAGVVLAGGLLAIGIILWHACAGDFLGWDVFFERFAVLSVAGFVLLAAVRWFTDKVLMPHSSLSHEIATDRNLAAAFVESGVAIGIAAIIATML